MVFSFFHKISDADLKSLMNFQSFKNEITCFLVHFFE